MKILIVHGCTIFDQLGGSEVQLHYIAEFLKLRGHEIYFYTMDFMAQKPQFEIINGFKIFRNNYIKDCLRHPYLHMRRILSITSEVKPNVLFARDIRSPYILYRVSEKSGIPFVYQLPLMFEKELFSFKAMLRNLRKFRSNIFNPFLAVRSFHRADCVLTNSKDDAIAVTNYYKISVQTIYNMHPIPETLTSFDTPPKVVWINNLKVWKRPELFINLARQLTGCKVEFIMAGKMPGGRYGEKLKSMIRKTSNVRYLGQISFTGTNHLFDSAYLNVLTSIHHEGFSNGSIQGWLRQVPLITTIDKDYIVRNHGLGAYVTNFEQMVAQVRYFLDNIDVRNAAGKRARDFAIKNFSIESNGPKYEQLFLKITK